jgi:hypothetical protein
MDQGTMEQMMEFLKAIERKREVDKAEFMAKMEHLLADNRDESPSQKDGY